MNLIKLICLLLPTLANAADVTYQDFAKAYADLIANSKAPAQAMKNSSDATSKEQRANEEKFSKMKAALEAQQKQMQARISQLTREQQSLQKQEQDRSDELDALRQDELKISLANRTATEDMGQQYDANKDPKVREKRELMSGKIRELEAARNGVASRATEWAEAQKKLTQINSDLEKTNKDVASAKTTASQAEQSSKSIDNIPEAAWASIAAHDIFSAQQKQSYDAKLLLSDFNALKANYKLNDVQLDMLKATLGNRLSNTLMGDWVNQQIKKAMGNVCQLATKCSNEKGMKETLEDINAQLSGKPKRAGQISDESTNRKTSTPATSGAGMLDANHLEPPTQDSPGGLDANHLVPPNGANEAR